MLSDCQVFPLSGPEHHFANPPCPAGSCSQHSEMVILPVVRLQPPGCSPGTRNLGLCLEGQSSPRRSHVPTPPTPCPCWWLLGSGYLNCWSPVNWASPTPFCLLCCCEKDPHWPWQSVLQEGGASL